MNDNATSSTSNACGGGSGDGRCPICDKPTFSAYRPFCSKRCADVDLGRWLRGDYAIPLPEGEAGSEDKEP